MSDERPLGPTPRDRGTLGLTRRQLIAGTVGLGFVGGATGMSTAAYLSDREMFTGVLTAGEVDLRVECADEDDAACVVDGDSVSLSLSGSLETCADTSVCLTVTDNPAWLWIRASAPTTGVDVSDLVWVELRYADGTVVEDGSGDDVSGTLRAVQARLASGIQIDADPATGEMDPLLSGSRLCLELRWGVTGFGSGGGSVDTACADVLSPESLDSDPGTDVIEPDPVAWELEFFGSQQRHDAEPTPPWDPAVVDDSAFDAPCIGCHFLGKYELPDDGPQVMLPGESYVLSDCDGFETEYAILVHDAVDKDGGSETTGLRSFSLIHTETAGDADPTLGPRVCRLDVKGGGGPTGGCPPPASPRPGTEVYELCPPTAEATGEFDAPAKAQKKKTVQTAISHVSVYVCGGDPPECL